MAEFQMSPSEQELWSKLQAFSFDDPSAAFDFSSRLGRENHWSREFTLRACEEYRRFLFMSMCAGHPVCPSEEVDEVWHLHLVYTRSYWQDLCEGILKRPLHHSPSAGGAVEFAKFEQMYERTLQSYERFFGHAPPEDLWPGSEARFAKKTTCKVDTQQYWILPKRLFGKWLRHPFRTSSLALLATLFLAGCSSTLNVFDWKGGEFLTFYVFAFGFTWIISRMIRTSLLVPFSGEVDPRWKDDPYAMAILEKGTETAVFRPAVASLFARGLIEVQSAGKRLQQLKLKENVAVGSLTELEAQIVASLQAGPKLLKDIRAEVQPGFRQIYEEMERSGLLYPRSLIDRLKTWTLLPYWLLLGVGVIKVGVGVVRDKPISFLLFLLIGTLIFIIARRILIDHSLATSAGKNLLRNANAEHGKAAQKRKKNLRQPQTSTDLALQAAMLVALGGTLSGAQFAPMRNALNDPSIQDWPKRDPSSSGCTHGCSTSCSSGGSSGCSSSGCGGCGGGD